MSISIPSVTKEISIIVMNQLTPLTLGGVRLAHKYEVVHNVLSLLTQDLSLGLYHSRDLLVTGHYGPKVMSSFRAVSRSYLRRSLLLLSTLTTCPYLSTRQK